MFRKFYKEANDDIKPSDEFVSSVIKKAKTHKPPRRRNFAIYAATAAAAVAVVSAAVIAMPMWSRVDNAKDGVIIEESAVETAKPDSRDRAGNTPVPQPAEKAADTGETRAEVKQDDTAKKNNTSEHSSIAKNPVIASDAKQSEPSNSSSAPSVSSHGNNTFSVRASVSDSSEDNKPQEPEKDSASSQNAETEQPKNTEQQVMPKDEPKKAAAETEQPKSELYSDVADEYEDIQLFSYSAASSASEKIDASEDKSAKQSRIDNADVPAPSGYYCTRAEWNGYTFVNDEGAVIIVSVSYGSNEESAPYYEQDGENIYATYSAYGVTFTVNASGADISSVKEIINSLR